MAKDANHLQVVDAPLFGKKELIARLENMLEQAKAGELRAIFFVELRTDKYWFPGWCGDIPDRLTSIGVLEALKYELLLEAAADT